MPLLCSSLSNASTEYTNTFNLHLHEVALLQPAVQFNAGSTSSSARTENFTRIERLPLRCVENHIGESVMHVSRIIFSPYFTIDTHCHAQVAGIQFVGCNDVWPKYIRAIPVLGFSWPHVDGQFSGLHITCRHIIPDCVAENIVERICFRDVLASSPDDGGKLKFIVKLATIGRPGNLLLRSNHCVGHTLVVDRNLVPLWSYGTPQASHCIVQVSLEREEIPQ